MKRKIFIVLIIVWVLLLVFLPIYSFKWHSDDLKDRYGNAAETIAICIANHLEIDDEEYERLLGLSFEELLKDPFNVEFEKETREIMINSDIKYIYIKSPIPEYEVKYRVEAGEEDIYNSATGAPLNVAYLLYAVISDNAKIEDTNGNGYTDKIRYNVQDERFEKIYMEKEPAHYVSNGQLGSYITGVAPFYSKSGKYLGLLGVDILIDKYYSSLRSYYLIITGFMLTNLVIGLLAIYLQFNVRKVDEKYQKASTLLRTDSVTTILSRHRFMEILDEAWEESTYNEKHISLLLIDMDYFKEYNDNYGHLAGDENLRKIAVTLHNITDKYNGSIGRYGGDEFIVLLPNTEEHEAENIANEMIKAIMNLNIEHIKSPYSGLQTISIGVGCVIPDKGNSYNILINKADKALYKSKRYGRNRVSV